VSRYLDSAKCLVLEADIDKGLVAALEFGAIALSIRECTRTLRKTRCLHYERYDPETGAGYQGCISHESGDLCEECLKIRHAIKQRVALRKQLRQSKQRLIRFAEKRVSR